MNLARARAQLLERTAGRWLLSLCAFVYGLGVALRNILYSLKLLPTRKLGSRTVCIGNLTVGGTGKTTAVLLAANTLRRKGVKAAILTRGYGRLRAKREVQVLVDKTTVSWKETGDEPWMMHQSLRGADIPILISPDRVKAGETALFYYKPRVLLLDDGFQHRRLRRDLDIVLISAIDPFGGGRLLPYGDLREPLSALKRAGMVIITHADQVEASRVEKIRAVVSAAAPSAELLEAVHRPDFIFDLKRNERHRLSHVKGKAIASLCGIGNPKSFEALLEAVEARVAQAWRYPDHHPYTLEEMRSIEELGKGMPVVTTFKDFPRFPQGWEDALPGDVLALAVRMEITSGKDVWEKALTGD
ncbi:MAG: tetraacyldisaccharide 4'-kinase [Elusimicrobiota bacterium]